MMEKRVRVRFAPSPTGPLNIGGLRTALYDYLFAKKFGGDFILRIEDTDAKREVPGTEQYILDALAWAGISPDEGPDIGGNHGPYRQSERKDIYQAHTQELIDKGFAYYAFDTPEEIEAMRQSEAENGNPGAKYNHATRQKMKNSLSLPQEKVARLIETSDNKVVRLKMPVDQTISFNDIVRDEVSFNTSLLDDKVMLKKDGMPTYHLANIVDDHLMEISHVIRGEEWLPSTAHHIFLYSCFGWEPPAFAHLSLILKPKGKGKLSKRDSAQFGFPVFPLDWYNADGALEFAGFKEYGFLPEALINFLAFLGWNPGTEQEIFSLEELTAAFSLDQMVKSGARFDIDKAKWYNQQYLINTPSDQLAQLLSTSFPDASHSFIIRFVDLMKERVENLNEFKSEGYYFFESPKAYDEKTIRKRYKVENETHFRNMIALLGKSDNFAPGDVEGIIKKYIEEHELGFGAILPIFRIALTGTTKGPDFFGTMSLLGKEESIARMNVGLEAFSKIHANGQEEKKG